MTLCCICKNEFLPKKREGRCPDCNKIYMKEYRKNNLEKVKAGQKDHYLRNTEKVKEKVKQYASENVEKVKERQAIKYQANREQYIQKARQYALENRDKILENKKSYYLKNSESIKKRAKQWELDNPEKAKERKFIYRQTHREEIKQSIKTWIENNRERYNILKRANYRNYMANKKGAEGKHTAEDVKKLYEEQKALCNICDCAISEYYEVDHIDPISKGGTNWPSNLQLLCLYCNRSKNNKTMDEFLIYLERQKECYNLKKLV